MVRENELKGFSPVSSSLSKNFAYGYFGLLVFFFPRYDVLKKKKASWQDKDISIVEIRCFLIL